MWSMLQTIAPHCKRMPVSLVRNHQRYTGVLQFGAHPGRGSAKFAPGATYSAHTIVPVSADSPQKRATRDRPESAAQFPRITAPLAPSLSKQMKTGLRGAHSTQINLDRNAPSSSYSKMRSFIAQNHWCRRRRSVWAVAVSLENPFATNATPSRPVERASEYASAWFPRQRSARLGIDSPRVVSRHFRSSRSSFVSGYAFSVFFEYTRSVSGCKTRALGGRTSCSSKTPGGPGVSHSHQVSN